VRPLHSAERQFERCRDARIDIGDDDNDHFIDPEERLRIAMARQ